MRVYMLNEPYGLFFAIDLPAEASNSFRTHNFYEDFRDLDADEIQDVKAFFEQRYALSNAVLRAATSSLTRCSKRSKNTSAASQGVRFRRSRTLRKRRKLRSAPRHAIGQVRPRFRRWPIGHRMPPRKSSLRWR